MTEPALTSAEVMRAAGSEPPEHIEPGRVMRFSTREKPLGTDATWCQLFADRTGGVLSVWPPMEPAVVVVNDPRPEVRVDLEKRVRAACTRTQAVSGDHHPDRWERKP
jgi:hypothetical protein